jgi:hypothetical protein
MRPLGEAIEYLNRTNATRERSREAARQVWRDQVFRSLDARSLQRLEVESRQFAGALTEVDGLLAQVLGMIRS